MAFSMRLKRTFEQIIDLTYTPEPMDSMAFRTPIKRQKLQMSSGDHGLEYREILSLEKPKRSADISLLCTVRQMNDFVAPELLNSPQPPKAYQGMFQRNASLNSTTETASTNENLLNLSLQHHSDLSGLAAAGQPIVGSACLNIPEIQALGLLSTSPRRANEVPMSMDESIGFDSKALLPQLFQHPSLRSFSVFKPKRYFLEKESNNSCQRIISDHPRQCFIGKNPCLQDSHVGFRSTSEDREATGTETIAVAEKEALMGQVEVCAECQKVFKRKVYLQRHMEREHWLPAKVFKCEDCKYETKHQSNLSVHRRTHTGERPYHCGACGQRYTQGHLLKSHIRSRHAGNLRFYNLDKRSDSTRGRKSLDFKHDIYFGFPTKVEPMISSFMTTKDSSTLHPMQNQELFTREQRRLSTYLASLSSPTLINTSWAIPGRSKMRNDWYYSNNSSSSSCLALGFIPQKLTNDLPFLPPAGHLSLQNYPVDMSLNLPVFSSGSSQLPTADRKASCENDSTPAIEDWRSADPLDVILGEEQTSMYIEDKTLSATDHKIYPDGETQATQEFAEDLRIARRSSTREYLPTPDTEANKPNKNDSADGTETSVSNGDERLSQQNIEASYHEEAEMEANTEAVQEQEIGERYQCVSDQCVGVQCVSNQCVVDRCVSGYSQNQSCELQSQKGRYPEELECKRERYTVDAESGTESPADLSTSFRSLISRGRQPTVSLKLEASRTSKLQSNGRSLHYPDSDDNESNISVNGSSDTSSRPFCGGEDSPRVSASMSPAAAAAALQSNSCHHFRKLQKFRRTVFRFVNAFAPNSLGINDDDFAETDLIDELVHAAMFNDVE